MNGTDVMTNGVAMFGALPEPVDEPSDEVIAELKTKHKNIFSTVAAGKTWVFRNATPKELAWFQKTIASKELILECSTQLAEWCCVYPEKAALKTVLNDFPGLATSMAGAINENSGTVHLDVKKY
jgi:hypothetical protein